MADVQPQLFSEGWYLQHNPDVAAAAHAGIISAYDHFRLYGQVEGRRPGPLFDPSFYLERNPDVAAAVNAGSTTAYAHFLQFGVTESRSPLALFDPAFYLQRNPDVAGAVATGTISAVGHLLQYGHSEARIITPFIDLGAYLRVNPDVANAVANGASALGHLLQYGLAEGRDLGNGVNLGIFSMDPVFRAALSVGDADAAIGRVQEIAPFLPDFVPPAGWQPPANTPIPMDFIPPSGTQLVIPPSVAVPPGMQLPETFKPVVLPTPTPTPGDDDQPQLTFTVENTGGIWTFGGTATGDITMKIDANGVIGFSRDGLDRPTTLKLGAWNAGDHVRVHAGQTLVLSPEQATRFTEAVGCGCTEPVYAFQGDGTIRIDTVTLDVSNAIAVDAELMGDVDGLAVHLLSISPTLNMRFAGSETISINDAVVLFISAEHANGKVFKGDGILQVSGNSESKGPVTLKVETTLANLITATPGDDVINVSAGTANLISAGKGQDTIALGTESVNVISIRAGMEGADNSAEVSADSTFNEMDVITGFGSGKDLISLADPLNGDPVNISVLVNGEIDLQDTGLKINVSNGIAKVSGEKLTGTDALRDVLEQLSNHMAGSRSLVAYEHDGATYLLYGDGHSGLQESDMVVKLAGLVDLSDVSSIVDNINT